MPITFIALSNPMTLGELPQDEMFIRLSDNKHSIKTNVRGERRESDGIVITNLCVQVPGFKVHHIREDARILHVPNVQIQVMRTGEDV